MEVVDSPTLDTFKIHLNRILGHAVQEALDKMIIAVTFNLVFYGSLSIPNK